MKKAKTTKRTKVLVVLTILVAIAPAYVRAYTIDGPSMSPTLWQQDTVISFNAAYDLRLPYTDITVLRLRNPSRNDLIVYFDKHKKNLAVKRVAGIPGDSIELKENVLYVNDVVVDQTVLPRDKYQSVPPENNLGQLVLKESQEGETRLITYTPHASEMSNYGPVVVPQGQYFILGDNRDDSHDSRYIGPIAHEQIKGRIVYGARR